MRERAIGYMLASLALAGLVGMALQVCLSLVGCATTSNPASYTFRTNDVRHGVVVGMSSSDVAGECPGADVDVAIEKQFCDENGVVAYRLDSPKKLQVLAALDAAIANLPGNALLVFSWSGHGGQQTDYDGDEEDGKDEVLYPKDAPLVDDELAQRFAKLPADAFVFCTFDTCNAGTMARRALSTIKAINPRNFKARMIVFSGCADGKSSLGSSQGGFLTAAKVDAFRPGITYAQWRDAIAAGMAAAQERAARRGELRREYIQVPVFSSYNCGELDWNRQAYK